MAGAWEARFILDKETWQAVDAPLSELFDAMVVKPVRDSDPTSPEEVMLVFEHQPNESELLAQLRAIFEGCAVDLPAVAIKQMPDIDWLQHVYETLVPIKAGRFFVHGSHIKDNIPVDKTTILIEAAQAFGTGEHPTTMGCLLVLDKLLDTRQPQRVLDMGAGSGILAIAVAKIVPDTQAIIGVDIHEPSVRVANLHATDNGVAGRVQFVPGDGFKLSVVQSHAPYDLVLANILAQPLIDMADDLCAIANGDIVLSGFTTAQLPYVQKPYLALGCDAVSMETVDEWVALWLRKN